MEFFAQLISPLEKVFYDDRPESFPPYTHSSALIGEKHGLCVAFRAQERSTNHYAYGEIRLKLDGLPDDAAKLYIVEHVPAVFASPSFTKPDRYLRLGAGLYPDVLKPYDDKKGLISLKDTTFSAWVDIDTEKLKAGDYEPKLTFTDENGQELAVLTHKLHVVNARLPEQTLMVTQWFHHDGILDYYKIKIFSNAYWTALENFIRTYVELGNNILYTPLFTPPLDTAVGGERTTVQTVDVKKDENGYTFGFDNLRRYISLAKSCGVRYFEMSHLFTQWGAFHAPKIIATVNGRKKRIFGWETDSHGKEYEEFLAAFLPELYRVLCEEKIADTSFFHISDEPMKEHLDSYRACSKILRKYLPNVSVMDAMGDVTFYDEKLVDIPVPFTEHAADFFAREPKPRFVYYCGAPHGAMGRALAMPSCRNRISGSLFYAYRVDGFLHWGFNFYNTRNSTEHVDPYAVTDAGKQFCAGDSFLVYPGKNYTAYPSLRAFVFRDGLQDMRVLSLCESLCGREAVEAVLKKHNRNKPLDLLSVPENDYYTELVREEIHALIEKNI